jgi:pimeloyl-ACP methyl ester carboxylesterase
MKSHRIFCVVGFMLALPALAQEPATCPKGLPEATACFNGKDANGAWYWIARPANGNGMLVMHAHGGPRTQAPKPESEVEDLERWSVMVKEGYAWAASSYRRGGYGVGMAAEDTENLRRLYIAKFGVPKRTLLHGQSWGGGVAAKTIELYAATIAGRANYDAVLLTSGVLGVNSLAYDFRADLRAVYQYYCHNHPRANEPQYALNIGLPAGTKMLSKDVEERVNECTGVKLPAGQRSAQQNSNLANITKVIRIQERSLAGHLYWATVLFQDIVHERLGGRSPFSNVGIAYSGSDDDAALNRGVARFAADSGAASEFAKDGDSTGKVSVPVLTIHAIDDPIAFIEMESVYRERLRKAGSADRLVQMFTKESEHSYLSSPEYAAMLELLVGWVQEGAKPTPRAIAAACERHAARLEGGCHFDLDYEPGPMSTRQYPRSAP